MSELATEMVVVDIEKIRSEVPARKRVTLSDIAQICGVSVPVVSSVLGGRSGNSKGSRCSEETASRIKSVGAALHYRPLMATKVLMGKGTATLGLILPSFAESYISQFLPACLVAADKKGYAITVTHAVSNDIDFDKVVSDLLNRDISGLVMFPFPEFIDSPIYRELIETRRPVVFVEHDLPGAEIDFIGMDDIAEYRQILSYLKKLGHEKIGLIYELQSDVTSAYKRKIEFMNVMDEMDLTVLPRYCWEASSVWSDGCEKVLDSIENAIGNLTALVVRGHKRTHWIYEGLKNRGVKIPEDISIMNVTVKRYEDCRLRFDGISTAINQIGARCVETLIERIESPESQIKRVLIPGELAIFGESTASVGC